MIQNFLLQIFTDAGQYVIRFGNADPTVVRLEGVKCKHTKERKKKCFLSSTLSEL